MRSPLDQLTLQATPQRDVKKRRCVDQKPYSWLMVRCYSFCTRGSRRDMTPQQDSLSGVIICPAYWEGQRLRVNSFTTNNTSITRRDEDGCQGCGASGSGVVFELGTMRPGTHAKPMCQNCSRVCAASHADLMTDCQCIKLTLGSFENPIPRTQRNSRLASLTRARAR